MLVLDAFEDVQLIRHAADGFVVVGLQGDLFHGHQFARFIVDGYVDLAEAALTFDIPIQFENWVIYNKLMNRWR